MRRIASVQDVETWIAGGFAEPAQVVGLDLTALDARFHDAQLTGSAFLDCTMGDGLAGEVRRQRVTSIAHLDALPPALSPFRHELYRVAELYAGLRPDGAGWERTPDFAGFDFFMESPNLPRVLDPMPRLAARLHDTSQEQAVIEFLHERDVVAIMGGHDVNRQLTDDDVAAQKPDVYWECVAIARALTEAGVLIVTGGGPGLMEAGNLGALLAGASDALVERVRAVLVNHPFGSAEWRATAMAARALILGRWSDEPAEAQQSLGIPTWLYGHEPPNFFASHHGKMFFNSLREDGLVTFANKGIIFFEGNAGTVQEIFQDATQNYYRPPRESATPMVFYDSSGYWDRPCDALTPPTAMSRDRRKPLLPLVRQLAAEKRFTDAVLVTASPSETVAFLQRGISDRRTRKADTRLANRVATQEG